MAQCNLTPEQEAKAQRLTDEAMVGTRAEVLEMFRLMMAKPDRELLGASEFDLRDRVHKIGARVLEAALHERKKGGTKVRV